LYPVGGMPGPSDVSDVPEALSWPAIELFEVRAQRVQPSFQITAEVLPHVVAIHRMTGGSPLAIELAAALVAVLPVADIAAEIAADLDFLQATTRSAPDRHRSLRVVFEHSWQRLHPKDRDCLQRLAVFRGGFTRDAAFAVAGATMAELASLVAQALVVPAGGDRYERHPLLRQYTWEKLVERPDTLARTSERHASWTLGVAKAAQAHFDTPSGGAWLDVLELEHANLHGALTWAAARPDATTLLELTRALTQFWIRRGHLAEALRWYDVLLHRTGPLEGSPELARSLQRHAFLHVLAGDTVAAEALLARSLDLARRLGAENDEADALSVLGIVDVYRGRYADARAHYAAGLVLARRNGYQAAIARLLNNLGDATFYLGDAAGAKAPYEECVALERALGNRQMTSNVLGSLALVAIDEGRSDEARRHLRESLVLLRDLGITFSVPTALEQAGKLATALGRPLDAAQLWGAAEALRASIRVPLEPFMAPQQAAWLARARAAADAGFDVAWSAGRRWSAADALDAALELTRAPS
ncbi:MAG: tetratricopeptide repeat protein, partial [Trueperaceae bacterium]|nr:tetratricopeptide repeat protein [Trueperaceae bacterium]